MSASPQNESKWHQMTSMEVAQELQVDLDQGLSTVDALARLKKYGPNILGVEKKRPAPEAWKSLYWLSIPLTLFVAALLSLLFTSQLGDSLLLAGLAICSMLFAVHWDVKAEINSTSLEKKALVRRDGQVTEINSTGLVPGDIVILATGARVPADGRLHLASRFGIDETALASGSSPVWKNVDAIETAQARPDQLTNMAFMNTTVIHGYGFMIVTSTGMNTKIGTTMGLLDQTELDKKPLHGQHRQMAMDLATVAVMSNLMP